MSGILRLSNDATGQSTLDTNATTDVTYSLPDTTGDTTALILTDKAHEVSSISWDGIDVTIQNGDINLDNGTLFVDHSESRVGIGTTSPQAKLDIFTVTGPYFRGGSDNTARQLIIESSTTTNPGDTHTLRASSPSGEIAFANSINSELVRIDRSGHLGVGTSSPDRLVHIFKGEAGAALSDGNTALMIENNTHAIIQMASPNNSSNRILFGDPQDFDAGRLLYDHSNNSFQIQVNASEAMRIDSSGRVGIGNTSPNFRLVVTNTSAGTDPGHLYLQNANATAGTEVSIGLGPNLVGDATRMAKISGVNTGGNATDLVFSTNQNAQTPSEKMRIDSSGRVLVGTNSGQGKFVVEGSLPKIQSNYSGTKHLEFGVGDSGCGFVMTTDHFMTFNHQPYANRGSDINLTERMRIDNNGRLSLGTTSNTFNSIEGKANFFQAATNLKTVINCVRIGTTSGRNQISFHNPNGNVGNISTSGSSTTYGTSSDYRLKENVVPLTNAADRLNQLQVRRFNFIADPDTTVDGFIAHETQAVVPEAVTGTHDEVDDDGKPVYQGIDQSKLVPLLTAALQETIAKVEVLEAEVSNLKANS